MLKRITLPDKRAPDVAKAKEGAERHRIAMAGMYRYAADILPQLPEPEQSQLRELMDAKADLLAFMSDLCSRFVLPVPSYLRKPRPS